MYVSVVRKTDRVSPNFALMWPAKEGNVVVGLDLGLKYTSQDQNDNAVIYQFLRKSGFQAVVGSKAVSSKEVCQRAAFALCGFCIDLGVAE